MDVIRGKLVKLVLEKWLLYFFLFVGFLFYWDVWIYVCIYDIKVDMKCCG